MINWVRLAFLPAPGYAQGMKRLKLKISKGLTKDIVSLLLERPEDLESQLTVLLDDSLNWSGPSFLCALLERVDGPLIEALVEYLVDISAHLVDRIGSK